MENLPPFESQPTITEQLAHLQRNDIQDDIRELTKGMAALQIASARQEEWREAVGARINSNASSAASAAATAAADIASLTKDMAEIKDLASRYKGGVYAVLGLGGALTGLTLFWDKLSHIFKSLS